jgi:methionyl aminopeptidase
VASTPTVACRGFFGSASGNKKAALNFSPMDPPTAKGVVSPMLTVDPIREKVRLTDYALSGRPSDSPDSLRCYTAEEIPHLRKAARLARKMLEFANSVAKPGMTTDEVDRLTHHEIIKHGAYPSPLNYCGFPKSICTSVNEVRRWRAD